MKAADGNPESDFRKLILKSRSGFTLSGLNSKGGSFRVNWRAMALGRLIFR